MKGIIGALTLALSLQAQAGEMLKFAKGNIDLRNAETLSARTDEADHQIWIIQFKSTIQPVDQRMINSTGARIYRYIPDDALVVRGSKQALTRKLGEKLQGVMAFRGDFKLSSALPTFSIFSSQHRDLYALTLIDKSEVKDAVQMMMQLDPQMRVVQQDGRFLDVVINSAVVPRLARISAVEFVEPKAEISLMKMDFQTAGVDHKAAGDYSDVTGFETGTKVMNFESAWKAGFNGQGQTVSVADTGLDRGEVNLLSPEFAGSVSRGYKFGAGAKNWSDPMGHGTHVAGSVAGRGTASAGRFKGGAPMAGLIPMGMWSPIIDNLNVPAKLGQLFQPAMTDGARIHTNSWGSPRNLGAYDSMAVQADEFTFNNPAMLVIFAAGNSGVDKDKNGVIDPNSIGSPGTSKNVLTVGASENYNLTGGIQRAIKDLGPAKENWSAEPIWSSKLSDNQNGIAVFSSRGPTADGRLKPEVVAPGTNILSAFSQETGADPLWGKYNDHYNYSGGTSMSAPLVAGAAAIAREMLEKKHGLREPSGAMVKAVLMHTAVDLFPGQYGTGTPTQELKTRRPNNDEGYGRVDLANLVGLAGGTQLVDNTSGVATGEETMLTVSVGQGQSLLANLVYADAPGSPASAQALVNNLDLILVGPGGQEQGSRDTRNNNEVIELSNLQAGTYKVIVRGVNVPMGKAGKQPYALALTVK